MADRVYNLFFGMSDGTEKGVAFAVPQGEQGFGIHPYKEDHTATIGDIYVLDITKVGQYGNPLRAGDLVLSRNGNMYHVTRVTAENFICECVAALKGKDGDIGPGIASVTATKDENNMCRIEVTMEDGTSKGSEFALPEGKGDSGNPLFYYSNTVPARVIGNGYNFDFSGFETYGRQIQVGDLILCANGYLHQVSSMAATYCSGICLRKWVGEDGKDGYTPVKGKDYSDGYTPVKGKDYWDGYTPVKGVDYFDGKDGDDGDKGDAGNSLFYSSKSTTGTVIGNDYSFATSELETNGRQVLVGDIILCANGYLYHVIQAAGDYCSAICLIRWVGEDGQNGEDGYTPKKGTDYYTYEEKQELVNEITAGLGGSDRTGVGENVSGKEFEVNGETIVAEMGAEVFNGSGNVATGLYSHAEGAWTVATGAFAHSEGNYTVASGVRSHAEGADTTASGDAAHSEGCDTEASGDYSHAEGTDTTASGNSSHVEGYASIARGYASHAEGYKTKATHTCAHAEGMETEADNTGAHAEGEGTVATVHASHVEGKYNIKDTLYKYAHILGNGASDTERSNAHTVDWDGNAWYAGDVYVGGTGQDDPNAKRLSLSAGGGVKTVNGVAPDSNGNVQIKVGSGSDVDVTAKPGQMIRVTSVDENGKPTSWEPVPWGYTEGEMVEILPETDLVEFTHPTFGKAWTDTTKAPNLIVGETYTVIYNGVPYDCVCHPGEDTGLSIAEGAFAIGNFGVVGGEDTGEPFAMLVYPATPRIVILDLSGATAVSIGIMSKSEIAHKVPVEFLPEGVPYSEYANVTVLEPITLTAQAEMDGMAPIMETLDVYDGMVCTVTYNGTDYACTATSIADAGLSYWYLGNPSFFGDEGTEGTDLPFGVIAFGPEAAAIMQIPGIAVSFAGDTTFTLGITGIKEVVHPVPKKFMADVRSQKKIILNLDTIESNMPIADTADMDTGEIQAALSVIYKGAEHAVLIVDREETFIEEYNYTYRKIDFLIAHQSSYGGYQLHGVSTCRWDTNGISVKFEKTLAQPFTDAQATVPCFYARMPGETEPQWRRITDAYLDAIVLKSTTSGSYKKFKLTVNDQGELKTTLL